MKFSRIADGFVVLIEPDAAVSAMICEVLDMGGYEVVARCNPAEALDTLEHGRPGLLIVNVGMEREPIESSVQMLAEYPGPEDLPVLLCSTVELDLEALPISSRTRRWAALRMPFDIDALLELLDTLIESPSAALAEATIDSGGRSL